MPFFFACEFLTQDTDGYALPYVKNIFIFAAVWCGFFFVGVAMQVEKIERVKGIEQAFPHTAKGRVVQETVIGDDGDNATFHSFHFPLGEAE